MESNNERPNIVLINKTITDNAASCLFMMDKDGYPTFMNPAAEAITGYTLDEIRGMPLHDAIHHHHPDGRLYPMCDCPIYNAQTELVNMKDYEDIFIRKDGTFFPVICYFAPLEEDGKVIGSVLEFRDVTEQKRAEEKVYESEAQYRSIFEQAAVGIIHVASNGNFLRVNKRFCEMTGYDEQEILGHTFRDITHPDDINIQDQIRKIVLEGRESSYTIEKRYIKKDSTIFWANLKVSLVRKSSGEPHFFISVIEDITESKQAEERLQKYSSQLDGTNKMLSRKNKELSIINKIGTILPHSLGLGQTLDNVLNKILDVLKTESAGIYLIDKESGQLKLVSCKGFSKKQTEILEKERSGDRLYNSVAKTHEPILIKDVENDKYLSSSIKVKEGILSIVVTPLISQEKVIGTLFLSTKEINRFASEDIQLFTLIGSQIGIALDNCLLFDEISKSKNEWEDTFNTISDSICIIDKDFRIVKANRGTLKLIGNEEFKDLLGKYSYEIFYGTDSPISDCPIIKCIQSNKVQYSEMYSKKLNKEILITAFPRFDNNKKIKEIVQVVRDITEQKSFETQVKTSYRMASLGRLTAGVFHEILNPVNIISSHVQLLLLEAENDSNVKKDLESIKDEIERIVRIVDSLLRYSRKEKTGYEDIKINDVIERVIMIVEPELKLKSVKITRKYDNELPIVSANSSEMRQVFLNLITNARDAMPDGGMLSIKTRSVRNTNFGVKSKTETVSELKGDFIEITFEDTGEGIKEKEIEFIFDPFFTTKREGEGTGFGLSESYNIIENHGGLLRVQSEERKGTTFTIDLPA